MKLVRTHQVEDLQSEIRRRFAEFNRSSKPSQGRRYPDELKELFCRASAHGMKVATLRRLTGLSSTAAIHWLAAKAKPSASAPVAARRLRVISSCLTSLPVTPIVIRLLSGVVIELANCGSLTHDLLAMLNATEVRHATSC